MVNTKLPSLSPVVFVGPSLPEARPSGFLWRPPAKRGDFLSLWAVTDIAVLIDSFLWSTPANSHYELLYFLQNGSAIVGAASMGALRAAELRGYGAIGVGRIYAAILAGRLCDDAELVVAMNPFNNEPISISTIEIRRILRISIRDGFPVSAARELFHELDNIYFLDRDESAVCVKCKSLFPQFYSIFQDAIANANWKVKKEDSLLALEFAMTFARDRSARPCDLRSEVDTYFYWDNY